MNKNEFIEHGGLDIIYDNLVSLSEHIEENPAWKVAEDSFSKDNDNRLVSMIADLVRDTSCNTLTWYRNLKEDLISIFEEDLYVNAGLNQGHILVAYNSWDPCAKAMYQSLFRPHACMEIRGDGYSARLDEDRIFYLMNVKKKTDYLSSDKEEWEGYELYMADRSRYFLNRFGGCWNWLIGICCSGNGAAVDAVLDELYQTVAEKT